MPTDWATQVRVERAKRGWTQRQLAHAVGTSQAQISRIEAGGQLPNAGTLDRIMAALDGAPVIDRSARQRYMPSGSGVLHELSVADMLGVEPPAVDWVVEGLAARGALTLFAGREGAGKSLLTQALSAGVAAGKPVAGIRCQPGRVWLIDAENGPSLIHRRMKSLGVTPEAAQRLKVWDATDGFDLAFDRWQVVDALDSAEHRPDLLVLDSFKSLWSGSEANPAAVVSVLNDYRTLAREHDLAVVLIHHTTKGGDTYRGSTAIGGAVEAVFTFTRAPRVKDEFGDWQDPDPAERVLICRKMRLDAEPATRYMRITPGGRFQRVETPDEGDDE